MPKRHKPEGLQVRVKTSSDAPKLAEVIIHHLQKECHENGRQWVRFSIDDMPKSVNHMFFHRNNMRILQPHVKEFRSLVADTMNHQKINWAPVGVTAVVIIFQSPMWITLERRVREMDVDNRVKPLLDAIQHATGQVDERHWHFHAFKAPSKRTRSTVYLFDLGDVVDYYF